MTAEGGDDRPIRYVETGDGGVPTKIVYRASSIGGCERAMVATARGFKADPHPEWFAEVLEEGNVAEPQICAMWDELSSMPTVSKQAELDLHLFDHELVYNNQVVEVPVIARCHIDGATVDPDGRVVIREFKKFRPSTFPNFLRQGCEVNVFYPWQVSIAMHAVRKAEGYYPVVELVGGLWGVLSGDPEGTPDRVLEVAPHYLDNPPIPLKALRQKVLRIERLLEEGFDPMDAEVVCHERQYPCGFWKMHPSYLTGDKQAGGDGESKLVQFAEIKKVPDEVQRDLLNVMMWDGQLKRLGQETRAITTKRDEIKKSVQTWLEAQGITPGSEGIVDGKVVKFEQWARAGYEVKPTGGTRVTVSPQEQTKVKVARRSKAPKVEEQTDEINDAV